MPLENVRYPISHQAKKYIKNTFKKCCNPPPNPTEIKENFSQKTGFRRYYLGEKTGIYRGWWKNNMRDGFGRQINNAKTEVYEGFHVQDKRSGYGILSAIRPNGKSELLFEGNFANGVPNGNGTLHTDTYHYIGHVIDGKASGFGKAWFKDGTFYVGYWFKGKRMGTGMLVNKNGTRYEGSWYNDKKHGFGQYYFFDRGQALEGVWIADVCKTGIIRNIKYRQTATNPTKYPIPKLMLKDWASSYYEWEKEAVAMVGKYVREDRGIAEFEKKEDSETSSGTTSSDITEQYMEDLAHQTDLSLSDNLKYPASMTEFQPCKIFEE